MNRRLNIVLAFLCLATSAMAARGGLGMGFDPGPAPAGAVTVTGSVIASITDPVAANVTETALGVPTVEDVTSTATSASVTAAVGRVWISIQNKAATESAFIYPGETATPGYGIEVHAGTTLSRAWGPTVPVSYVSTGSVPLLIDQEVTP